MLVSRGLLGPDEMEEELLVIEGATPRVASEYRRRPWARRAPSM
jgi:hypothetical protein